MAKSLLLLRSNINLETDKETIVSKKVLKQEPDCDFFVFDVLQITKINPVNFQSTFLEEKDGKAKSQH